MATLGFMMLSHYLQHLPANKARRKKSVYILLEKERGKGQLELGAWNALNSIKRILNLGT